MIITCHPASRLNCVSRLETGAVATLEISQATMPKPHRRRDRATSSLPAPSFDAAAALEALHSEIVDIEAFAHAAGEAVIRLPHTSNPELRRVFARIYTLVSKVATDVHAAVRHGDKLIAELSAHLQRRASEPAARRPELASRRADDE
jgi:hypothetical protein